MYLTLNFKIGIAHGVWVVGLDWAQQSLKLSSGTLAEVDFEINADQQYGKAKGAEKARQSRAEGKKLMHRYALYCHPPFDAVLPKPSVIQLIKTCGAQCKFINSVSQKKRRPASIRFSFTGRGGYNFGMRFGYNTGIMCGYKTQHSKNFCAGMTAIRPSTQNF